MSIQGCACIAVKRTNLDIELRLAASQPQPIKISIPGYHLEETDVTVEKDYLMLEDEFEHSLRYRRDV